MFTYLKLDVELWFFPSTFQVRLSSNCTNKPTIEILPSFVIPFVVFQVLLLRIPVVAVWKPTGPHTYTFLGYFYKIAILRAYYATYIPDEYHSRCTVSKWSLISHFFRSDMPQQIAPFALLAYCKKELINRQGLNNIYTRWLHPFIIPWHGRSGSQPVGSVQRRRQWVGTC